MPDKKSNVYIDLSLLASKDFYLDLDAEFTAGHVENIGCRTMLVESLFTACNNEALDTELDYSTVTSNLETDNVPVDILWMGTLVSGEKDRVVDFFLGPTASGMKDLKLCFGTYATNTVYRDVPVIFTGGNRFNRWVDILSAVNFRSQLAAADDSRINYTNFSGNYTVISGLPIPHMEQVTNVVMSYGCDPSISGGSNVPVDLFFAAWIGYPFLEDVFSSDMRVQTGHCCEYGVTPFGRLWPCNTDVFSSVEGLPKLNKDVYCALLDLSVSNVDVELTHGRLTEVKTDVFSSADRRQGVCTEISLYSLKITNFSIGCSEYVNVDGYLSADVVDDVCPVSISGTYMSVDGERVQATFSGIDYGYRVFFDLSANIDRFDGPTEIHVHAENECGNSIDSYNYVTFGYIVEYENNPLYDGEMDQSYGYDKKVSVRVTVEDMASCPRSDSFAYIFGTEQQKNKDLGASITGKFFADGFYDIGAGIYPQSTAYFYGKEFEVVVRAEDFSGNAMEPFVLKYRIENKPR